MGKIGALIESSQRAASKISYSPITTVSVMSTMNGMDTADWQLKSSDASLFIWGVTKWAYPTKKVAK